MIFGIPITGTMMAAGGITLFLLLSTQVSIGLRWLKLGRKSFTYHRYLGITIWFVALGHATLGILFVTGLRLF
jgi:DMSO/TMAO reductase YedYZ heme-binding membrane subunit